MSIILEVKNVSKSFKAPDGSTNHVLQNLSVSVEEGKFVTIVGPSGIGKSTFLDLVGGLKKPDEGEITLVGESVTGPQPDVLTMVFQDASLFPWRTAIQNVEFGLELKGVEESKREEVAMKYLELTGIAKFRNYFPSQLSGGMQQRVSVARALTLDPKILVMDEPFGALDEQSRFALGDELVRIQKETGKTILFVTHSLIEATYLADKIIVLSGKPAAVKAEINIDVKKPRNPDDPGLVEIRRQLWSYMSAKMTDLGGEGTLSNEA
ncbi:hypothetical protein IX51_08880 [uncultured archaeon]|nr:hypothetical protein IX51_08880 [uncultured archaeon]